VWKLSFFVAAAVVVAAASAAAGVKNPTAQNKQQLTVRGRVCEATRIHTRLQHMHIL